MSAISVENSFPYAIFPRALQICAHFNIMNLLTMLIENRRFLAPEHTTQALLLAHQQTLLQTLDGPTDLTKGCQAYGTLYAK